MEENTEHITLLYVNTSDCAGFMCPKPKLKGIITTTGPQAQMGGAGSVLRSSNSLYEMCTRVSEDEK